MPGTRGVSTSAETNSARRAAISARDTAADVVADEYRPVEAQLCDQPEHTARLRGSAVLGDIVRPDFVRFAKNRADPVR